MQFERKIMQHNIACYHEQILIWSYFLMSNDIFSVDTCTRVYLARLWSYL